jgi:hypothetical protein
MARFDFFVTRERSTQAYHAGGPAQRTMRMIDRSDLLPL